MPPLDPVLVYRHVQTHWEADEAQFVANSFYFMRTGIWQLPTGLTSEFDRISAYSRLILFSIVVTFQLRVVTIQIATLIKKVKRAIRNVKYAMQKVRPVLAAAPHPRDRGTLEQRRGVTASPSVRLRCPLVYL